MEVFGLVIIMLVTLFLLVLALIKINRLEYQRDCVPRVFQFNNKFDNYTLSDPLRFPFSKVIEKYGIQKVDKFEDANIILFSDYTLYDQNFNKINYKPKCNYKVFAINGVDLLANKKILAQRLEGTEYIPKSYPLGCDQSMKRLLDDHKNEKMYILKKNIQRQEGNLITTDVNYILGGKAHEDSYVVAQELLQDPLLVNGRKINMRIYLLIVIKKNLCDWYIYNDGFIYYTPKHFVKGSSDKDVNITTGYIDRKVYEENPLTIKDLYKDMGIRNSHILQKNIEKCVSVVKNKYRDDFVKLNSETPGIKFCVYGIDIAPNEDLDVVIIEANKGCSLNYHDERDGALKFGMIRDAFAVVNILDTNSADNFIEINES